MHGLGVPILDAQTPLTLFALLLVPLIAYALNRTPLGLAVRMVGENPQAAEGQGVSVAATRTGAIVTGSAHGRVRALINALGESMTEAPPSMPVQVLGLTAGWWSPASGTT